MGVAARGSPRLKWWGAGLAPSFAAGASVAGLAALASVRSRQRWRYWQRASASSQPKARRRASAKVAELVEAEDVEDEDEKKDEDDDYDEYGNKKKKVLKNPTPVQKALMEWEEKEPIVFRYMDSALDPWPADYLGMLPLRDDTAKAGEGELGALIGKLEDMQEKGPLRDVRYAHADIGDEVFVLCSVDVQGHGFVCGLGMAKDPELAEQLAAKQALSRLKIAEDPIQTLLDAAEKVKDHKDHKGAAEPARHAAEAIIALKDRLKDLGVSAFNPCGKAWMSSIALQLPGQEGRVGASSADWDEDTAVALTAEMLIGRLRWALKVPHDAPHEPAEWAKTVDERIAAERLPKKRGQGPPKKQENIRERIRVRPLGSDGDDDAEAIRATLEVVLGEKDGRSQRSAALAEAIKSRAARRVARALGGAGGPADLGKAARRLFEVTPTSKDRRRKELVGQLPVEAIRNEISAVLEHKQVCVVSGGTGSGKSTQMPQFLMDDWKKGGDGDVVADAKIIVTQPRRLAAVSIAERVAWERNEEIGQSVGYSVRGNTVKPTSSGGTVEFVTVGTLLRRAMDDPDLSQCNLIIVDEVHERDLMSDFLIILMRDVLPRRPDLRVVLMSATLDVDTFVRYFGDCPVLEVPSATRFPVHEVHLGDDFFANFSITRSLVESEEEGRNTVSWQAIQDPQETYRKDTQAIWWGSEAGDTTFVELMEETILRVVPEVLATAAADKGPCGAILCFLPGWAEIRRLMERLQESSEASKMWVLPLHSTLPKEQQVLVFDKGPAGKVKVILGTNIAESSVTINDVTIVVDSGLQRELTYDARRRMSYLDTVWVSRSSAVQRKGRAGRVREGRVYRLYSRDQLEAVPARPIPQMQRCDLAQSCLSALALGHEPRSFLARAPDPPRESAIDTAMEHLAAIDAVSEGLAPRILPVGEVITKLPLEPGLGRAMMTGVLFGMPEMTAALLVVSGGPSPFIVPPGRQKELLYKRRELCGWSDTLVSMQALLVWESMMRRKGEKAANSWALQSFLSVSRLRNLSRSKFQLLRDCKRAGLLRGVALASAEAYNPLADDDDEEAEEAEDAVALFESLEDTRGMIDRHSGHEEWMRSMCTAAPDVEGESLLPAVLCSAYPSNLALRRQTSSRDHATLSFTPAKISPSSVNMVDDNEKPADKDNSASWWLYNEMQVSGGRATLQGSTKLTDWQVGVFGGLKAKEHEVGADKRPEFELDGWVSVEGDDLKTGEMISALRGEMREALSWNALATLHGRTPAIEASARRARRFWQAVGGALGGEAPKAEDVEFLKTWDLAKAMAEEPTRGSKSKAAEPAKVKGKSAAAPKVAVAVAAPEASSVASSAPAASTGDKSVADMSVPELKELLKSMNEKVAGKKAELVERAEAALAARK